MANKIKAKLALQLREAGVSANKVYAAHRISKKSQKEVLEAAAGLGITIRRRRGPAGRRGLQAALPRQEQPRERVRGARLGLRAQGAGEGRRDAAAPALGVLRRLRRIRRRGHGLRPLLQAIRRVHGVEAGDQQGRAQGRARVRGRLVGAHDGGRGLLALM